MSEDFPRQIGRYEVITLLGEGGMARAYLAVSHGPGGFNKLAVIKQILPKLARDAEFVAMFLDEARLAARLHHPNVVQTFDVVEHRGGYVLAMEYLEGLSLSTIYKRIHPRLLPVEIHLWVLTQVLAGLHYAHTLCDYDGTPLGVVHRDVNPANILVTFGGDVKLLDFGVAKARGALASSTERSIRGKPGYCAPEQLRGLEPDARADVFAVGVMLWEVLAGRRFNRGRNLVEAAKIRLSGKEPRIRRVCPDIDPMLADICDRALAMDPTQRFTSAAEFRMELQAQLDKRNGLDRRILVERLDEVFAADRHELRKLIETCLADTTTPDRPCPVAETEPSGEQTRPLGPVPKPISVHVKTGGDAHPRSVFRPRLLVGLAVLAMAVLSGILMLGLSGPPGKTDHTGVAPVTSGHGLSVEATATSSPLPPSASVPLVPLAVILPEPKEERMADAAFQTAALTARIEARVPVARLLPARPHKRAAPPPPVRRPAHAIADRRTSARKPETSSVLPTEEASISPSFPGRHSPPGDAPTSAVQPGTQLFRRTAPVRNSLDEKDPYTP